MSSRRATAQTTPRCTSDAAGTTVSLPVLGAGSGSARAHGAIAVSRASRWRAGVLVLVHVIIGVHVLQWLVTGMTLSPVEPSESMQTLRQGVVNAGFVFFVLAIGSTLVLGRFFCGWACHVVALQDLCAWMMERIRVKPRPFRSRLLVYVPLVLALYMFVWPVVHREVIRPVFADASGRLPVWLGQSEALPGLMTDFLVEDFWATFPAWYVAIPFLLVIGFGSVYFLGSKGFCTYGCPYGGFFGPADLLAPGKIRVTDDCEHCGHCTAVCTSNVRVHEEVRDFGMVVDPGCMKCMDCVSVCPNDALYFGFGVPAIVAKPRNEEARASAAKARALRESRYDLSRAEEWAAAVLFLFLFLAYRGAAHLIPMLMGAGIAGIGVFLSWKSWTMLWPGARGEPNVRLQSLQLKLRGRILAPGYGVLLGTLLLWVGAVWGFHGNLRRTLAQYEYDHLGTPLSVVLRPDFEATPGELVTARRALSQYQRAGGFKDGGLGWAHNAAESLNIAYMHVLLGDVASAEACLDRVVRTGNPRDNLMQQLAALMRVRGATADEVRVALTRALELHPMLDGVRAQLASERLNAGDFGGGLALWDRVLHDKPVRASMLLGRAQYLLAAGANDPQRRDEAVALADQALARAESADTILSVAGVLAAAGQRERAVELVKGAYRSSINPGAAKVSAAGMLAQLGQPEAALELAQTGVARVRTLGRHSSSGQALLSAGTLLLARGQTEKGLGLIRESVAAVAHSPWDLAGIGATLLQIGLGQDGSGGGVGGGSRAVVDLGVSVLEQARDAEPDSPVLRSDLATAYYATERFSDALREMKAAGERSRRNPVIAQRLADLLADQSQPVDAAEWRREAERRAKENSP